MRKDKTARRGSRGRFRYRWILSVVVGILLAETVAGAAQAGTSGDYGGQIPRGGVLASGHAIYSDRWIYSGTINGIPYGIKTQHYKMIMQADGNLVIYSWQTDHAGDVFNRWVCWASNTNSSANVGSRATYQSDGNFVVRNPAGRATWASNTVGGGGTTVNLNPYGALYVGTTRKTANCDEN